ncbi:MAG: hypothetical protein E6J71_02600 [Deltaproteobacteria bacterium]|nr:MAG: hypothetical protein E6J77_01290 [Deltaproteobacteria bacterium]TMB23949.1 MAG: hypothetical protein E6J71_02600 [Deltaproteobacteria bacterium]
MASTTHLATPEDDARHVPGKDSLPLWNESYWFPFYDPRTEIGVVFRAGIHANLGQANLFLFVTQGGAVVHTVVDHRAPVPPIEPGRLSLSGLSIEWERPLERFRLRYGAGSTGFDVVWQASSPAYRYPHPPGMSSDQIPGHIEQGGTVTGTVTIGGTRHAIDAPGHRDHSWGGERDWAKFHRWNYLSGEIEPDFWFNAVRIDLGTETDLRIGGLWDGRELLDLRDIEIKVETVDAGTRQTGVTTRLVDERGREHRIVGEEVLVNCPVQFGRTWLKDGITRYRYGDRIGYGILEHGYVEER